MIFTSNASLSTNLFRKSEGLAKVFTDGILELKVQLKEDPVRHFFRFNVLNLWLK